MMMKATPHFSVVTGISNTDTVPWKMSLVNTVFDNNKREGENAADQYIFDQVHVMVCRLNLPLFSLPHCTLTRAGGCLLASGVSHLVTASNAVQTQQRFCGNIAPTLQSPPCSPQWASRSVLSHKSPFSIVFSSVSTVSSVNTASRVGLTLLANKANRVLQLKKKLLAQLGHQGED